MTSRHVAVIGSGAAGTMAAHRLRTLLGPEAVIHVFERSGRVGGRARDVEIAGERIELGGTLIHSDNRRLVDLVAEVGCTLTRPDVAADADETIGLFGGTGFVLESAASDLPRALISRYGLPAVLRLRRLARQAKSGWNRVYRLQDHGALFAAPGDVLTATGLDAFTDRSLHAVAARAGIPAPLIVEFATGILRNMYNQNADVVALAGLVGLAGAGLAGGRLASIEGGNASLFEAALSAVDARVHLGTTVTAVSRDAEGLVVAHDAGPGRGIPSHVDAVILAAPRENAGVHIEGAPPAPPRRYRDVHVTLVAGEADPSFFGVGHVPDHVFTLDAGGVPFRSLGTVGRSRAHDVPIWKVFSGTPVDDALLERLFPGRLEVHRHHWQAYPELSVPPALEPFRLVGGVYGVNTFESVVSTLETEATIGRSVADLAVRELPVR